MQATVQVYVHKGDPFNLSPSEAADAVLKALGGNEDTDFVTVSISIPAGSAGTNPEETVKTPEPDA